MTGQVLDRRPPDAGVLPESGAARAPRRLPARIGVTAVLVAAAVAAWVAVTTSGGGAAGGAALATVAPTPAPPLSLPAVTGGAPVSLAAAAGRPVMLSFFASWCTGCQQELATMSTVTRLAGSSVEIIGIDVNDANGPARALLRAHHLTYPVGADNGGGTASAYGLVGLPTTVFLDAGHRVVGRVVGPLQPALAATWLGRLRTTTSSGG